MSSWLGIAIAVAFSLGLALFMRLDSDRKDPALPHDLGRWSRCEENPLDVPTTMYEERRLVLQEGRWFFPARLVEQRRRRSAADHRIIEVLAERPVRRGARAG